mmetsp:Transcript_61208/g.197909  ORF Transcript_61208/g.197909 Transcript_61208/m.197909 type:complete len:163 (-) Transcript_61208:1354-1842(-)
MVAMRRAVAVLAFGAVGASGANSSVAFGLNMQGICDSIHGLQCYGDDLKDIGPVTTHEACCQACDALAGCQAWTWTWQVGKHCYFKSACSDLSSGHPYHSGVVSYRRLLHVQLHPRPLRLRARAPTTRSASRRCCAAPTTSSSSLAIGARMGTAGASIGSLS